MWGNLAVRAMLMKDRLVLRFKSEKGDLVQWIIIIAIVLGLAIVFREHLLEFINSVWEKMKSLVDG